MLAPAGITGSLNTNLSMSAKDCSKPKGPTTFGPRLSCTAAQIFLSASNRKATATSNITSTARECVAMTRNGQTYAVQNSAIGSGRPRCAIRHQGAQLAHHR